MSPTDIRVGRPDKEHLPSFSLFLSSLEMRTICQVMRGCRSQGIVNLIRAPNYMEYPPDGPPVVSQVNCRHLQLRDDPGHFCELTALFFP